MIQGANLHRDIARYKAEGRCRDCSKPEPDVLLAAMTTTTLEERMKERGTFKAGMRGFRETAWFRVIAPNAETRKSVL